MNDHTTSTLPTVPATPADGRHPAGDICPRRSTTTGRRAAYLLGMTGLSDASASGVTTISITFTVTC